MLNWNLHSFKLLEIIQVLDSISWVRCASGNVFNHFCKERFVRGARAAILCYAVTDPESWERLQFWVRFLPTLIFTFLSAKPINHEIETTLQVSELQAIEEKCRLYVAATKLDLISGHRNRQVQ